MLQRITQNTFGKALYYDLIVWISPLFPTVQAEVDRLEGLVDAEVGRADYILDAAEDNIDAFAQSLHQQNQRHQRRKQAELQRQRQVLARAAAEELVRERRQRMSALREVRLHDSNLIPHDQWEGLQV